MIIWLLITAWVTSSFATHYGANLMYLDPEYMGNVGFFSFLIIGFSLGGFIMTWNTCSYFLNSFRFKFLASLSKPFYKYCINNSIIPLTFITIYSYCIYKFQLNNGWSPDAVFKNIVGLISGLILMCTLTIIYFTIFDTDVNSFLKSLKNRTKKKLEKRNIHLGTIDIPYADAHQWRVETYLSSPISINLVRNVDHYDNAIIERVLGQRHVNAYVIIFISLFSLFALGSLIENPIFRLPAGASYLIMLTVLMAIASLLTQWFKGWRFLAIFIILFGANYLSKFDMITYKNHLVGLDYDKPRKRYDNSTIRSHISNQDIIQDVQDTKSILNRWYRKSLKRYGNPKPKMVFICSAGGGSKSSYFNMQTLQEADKALNGSLMQHAVMISGASGGMYGASYFRELYWRHHYQGNIDCYNKSYLDDIGKDLLNAISVSTCTNDIFFPWQKYTYNGFSGTKDRGYWLDKQFNENTQYLMDKRVVDYKILEKRAQIPMVIMSPTIINDQKSMYISAQGISYLTRPFVWNAKGYLDYLTPDGIEFMRFFKDYNAESLNYISALRMNASYPYIMPSISMPTYPEMKILDAGIRENYGINAPVRFCTVFKDWIDKNTSGVIFVVIRTDNKLYNFDDALKKSTFLDDLILPMGNLFTNFLYEQEYNNDMYVSMLENMLTTEVNVVPFIYTPTKGNDVASMSWHLSYKEKKDIEKAFFNEKNTQSLAILKKLLSN
jgi:hypothetical protein